MRAEPFFVAPLLDDNRAVVAMSASGAVLAQAKRPDEARAHFEALAAEQLTINGNPQSAIQTIEPAAIVTLSDALFLADALLARSRAEVSRLRNHLRGIRDWIAIAPGIDPSVPTVESRGRGGPIVVWAPHLDASKLGVIAYALDQLLLDSVLICSGGSLPNVRAAFVSGDVSALAGASVIVDASISDPSTALALARCGVPLVCSTTSGAHEFLNGVHLYDPWNWKTVLDAVSAALCGAFAVQVGDPMPDEALRRTLHFSKAPVVPREPLFSVVITTYNRPGMLDSCLSSFDNHTYKNLELLVVNDGGEPVEHVVAKYPRARLVNRENGGPIRAGNTGVRAARGEYFVFCADDDFFFPDAFSRFVAAFEFSGAPMVNSNGIIVFMKTAEDGEERVVGYRWHTYLALDRLRELGSGGITAAGVAFRRDVFVQHGLLEEENRIADYEIILRLMQHYDMPHVEYVTFAFVYRMDKKGFSHDGGSEALLDTYRNLWERYPSNGNAIIDRGRAEGLGWLARGHGGHFWEPAIYLPEPKSLGERG